MNVAISFLPTVALLVSLGAIFVVIFLAVLKILKNVSLFGGRTAVIMASCVAVLCIVGLAQLLVEPRVSYDGRDAGQKIKSSGGYELLPYVALSVAAAVILSQLLLIGGKTTVEKLPETSDAARGPKMPTAKPDKQVKASASTRKTRKKRTNRR